MLIRPFDDLHNEISPFRFVEHPVDPHAICVLAGDVGIGHKPETWVPVVKSAAEIFKKVIYVLGNHEHYYGNIQNTVEKMREMLLINNLAHKVIILDNEVEVINDTAFIGTTLWTDFDRGNPLAMHAANHGLNDYRMIGFDRQYEKDSVLTKRLLPSDILVLHNEAREFIRKSVIEYKGKGLKTCVVVHHGVSYMSISPFYKNDPLNPCFVSDMFEDIMELQPNLIIHGHVHYALDYQIGETRVICNPRGYEGYEYDTGFDPLKLIEL